MGDAYELLGVPADADDATIAKRYRELALQLHPDRTSDPEANSQLEQLNVAYSLIRTPQLRSAYDSERVSGAESAAESGATPEVGVLVPAAQQGGDLWVRVPVLFSQQLTQVVFQLQVWEYCKPCRGTGADQAVATGVCSTCRGLRVDVTTGAACQACQGSGVGHDSPCGVCAAQGATQGVREFAVMVPKLASDRHQVTFKLRGLETPTGRAGDLHLELCVSDYPAGDGSSQMLEPPSDAVRGSEVDLQVGTGNGLSWMVGGPGDVAARCGCRQLVDFGSPRLPSTLVVKFSCMHGERDLKVEPAWVADVPHTLARVLREAVSLTVDC